jgi:glycosyltransferase involved in cell wall biosynthesis
MNPCLLIPIFEHGSTIGAVLDSLAALELPCLVVDDGSGEPTRRTLARAAARHPWVTVERRPHRGRGAALRHGYRVARERGFSHALQLDADGQHDAADGPRLLAAARRRPQALILGDPRFDASAPSSRRWGRWISRVWVWIETGSLEVADPLCGYRCVPLEPMLRVLEETPCGDHMDFDTETVVRLVWSGVPVENVPVRIRYFEGGLSHFHMVRDNLRITRLHTRLVLELLARLARPREQGASRA